MSIVVMSDVRGDRVTLLKTGDQTMTMTVAEAYQLYSHLKFTLDELTYDEVVKDRQQLITARYQP